jgi:hypothetical protein
MFFSYSLKWVPLMDTIQQNQDMTTSLWVQLSSNCVREFENHGCNSVQTVLCDVDHLTQINAHFVIRRMRTLITS